MLDVRVKLGQAVKAGDVLMVIDAADIARAYAAYVEEISELGLAERNYELTKDLYDAQAMALKDLEHAENDLNRERAEFKQAKERLLSSASRPPNSANPSRNSRLHRASNSGAR